MRPVLFWHPRVTQIDAEVEKDNQTEARVGAVMSGKAFDGCGSPCTKGL
jgi:hypothetical protein